jgi:hypothetical protein
MGMMPDHLLDFMAEELNRPVAAAAQVLAVAARERHAPGTLAVLFYGSCLRQPEASLAENVLDFYVLVDAYRNAYRKTWLAVANRILPPNAFHFEIPWQGTSLRAKYVVISLRDFERACRRDSRNVSIWARFAQPARLVWSRDAAVAERVVQACTEAVLTTLTHVRPLEPDTKDATILWTRALRETYAAELRAEGADRAEQIVTADLERYRRLTAIALDRIGPTTRSKEMAERDWRHRRLVGKTRHVARLIKDAFTFTDGLDYVLWKIRKHSGVTIAVTEWQRRHPLLAAPGLAWRLYRMGAFR